MKILSILATAFLLLTSACVCAEKTQLACIAVKYEDTQRYVDHAELRTMCNGVKEFYQRNSYGDLIFEPDVMVVDVPLRGNKGNVYKAEKLAIDTYEKKNGHNRDRRYAVITMFRGFSHAGSHIAHLEGSSIRTACHEIGHTLDLGHSGRYENGKLDDYGDNQSIMSRYPSCCLTAPQYHSKKWITNFHNYDPKISDYKICRITSQQDCPKYVLIKQPDGRNIFLSYPIKTAVEDFGVSFHYGIGGSSQLLKTFKNEFESNGYKFKVTKIDDTFLNIEIVVVR